MSKHYIETTKKVCFKDMKQYIQEVAMNISLTFLARLLVLSWHNGTRSQFNEYLDVDKSNAKFSSSEAANFLSLLFNEVTGLKEGKNIIKAGALSWAFSRMSSSNEKLFPWVQSGAVYLYAPSTTLKEMSVDDLLKVMGLKQCSQISRREKVKPKPTKQKIAKKPEQMELPLDSPKKDELSEWTKLIQEDFQKQSDWNEKVRNFVRDLNADYHSTKETFSKMHKRHFAEMRELRSLVAELTKLIKVLAEKKEHDGLYIPNILGGNPPPDIDALTLELMELNKHLRENKGST